MNAWPYWLKGALLAIPLYLVIAPLSFFVLVRFFGVSDDIIQFIGPEFFFGMWAFVGEPERSEIINTVAVLGSILIARMFVLGAILGAIYGRFAVRGKRALFFILLAVTYLVVLGGLSYWLQNPGAVYYSAKIPADCRAWTNGLINNFSTTGCYRELAERTKDVAVCDEIQEGMGSESAEEQRAYCYKVVAEEKKDPSICPLISLSGRRDSCYHQFRMCEKVSDVGWRDNCWSTKARVTKDPTLCSNISKPVDPYVTRCLAEIKP